MWAVFNGTQSRTNHAKDAVEYTFAGNRLTWYGWHGSAMGKADVYVDGKLDQIVDTYDADEIPNVALYSRTLSFNQPGHGKDRGSGRSQLALFG